MYKLKRFHTHANGYYINFISYPSGKGILIELSRSWMDRKGRFVKFNLKKIKCSVALWKMKHCQLFYRMFEEVGKRWRSPAGLTISESEFFQCIS